MLFFSLQTDEMRLPKSQLFLGDDIISSFPRAWLKRNASRHITNLGFSCAEKLQLKHVFWPKLKFR